MRRSALWLTLMAALLAGCHGGVATRHDTPGTATMAEQLLRDGHYAQAAAHFAELAETSAGQARQAYLLQAADAWFRAHEDEQAIGVLRQIDARQLDAAHATWNRLLTARAALARGAPRRALALLDFDGSGLEAARYRDWREYRALAHERTGDYLQGVNERIALGPWLSDPAAIRDNGRAILATLRNMSVRELEADLRRSSNPVLKGWIELALIMRSVLFEPDQFRTSAAQWRSRYPDHPGNLQLSDADTGGTATAFRRPHRIALLLPLSGRFSAAARAVRDGFMAAWYADTTAERRPVVRVFEVAETPLGLNDALHRATLEGADLIVGPLERDSIRELNTAMPAVPVLGLNYIDEAPAPQLYQFGLSPEQEARQTAQRARVDAGSRALVMYPDDDWGRRMHDAFVTRFRELGGIVVATAPYAPTATDYSATLERLLELDASQSRKQRLQNLLGEPLDFEPRRRQDVDFVFMAARPPQARSIKPQLRFHRASDLAVYATSHVFTGVGDPARDRDMDGIVFCDIPWLLSPETGAPDRAAVSAALPGAAGPLARLYALGIDAYQIAPYLQWLRRHPGDAFPGNTGWLSMDAEGRVRRQLPWARFLGGRPRLITGPGQSLAGR